MNVCIYRRCAVQMYTPRQQHTDTSQQADIPNVLVLLEATQTDGALVRPVVLRPLAIGAEQWRLHNVHHNTIR